MATPRTTTGCQVGDCTDDAAYGAIYRHTVSGSSVRAHPVFYACGPHTDFDDDALDRWVLEP